MRTSKTMKVVMLSTNQISNIAMFGKLYYDKEGIDPYVADTKHLYIVSDNDIKEGDWFENGGYLYQAIRHYSKAPSDRKIEATTNTSLLQYQGGSLSKQLPQIPQSFIEAYIKAEGKITEVDVEIEEFSREVLGIWRIKTRPDNTIIIHQSKTYTRDEVIDKTLSYFDYFMKDYAREGAIDPLRSIKWFEQNL